MKASENEIFFVEDDLEDDLEDEDGGQFNDIPTKLELRTNDFCTHLINKSLLKEFMHELKGKTMMLNPARHIYLLRLLLQLISGAFMVVHW